MAFSRDDIAKTRCNLNAYNNQLGYMLNVPGNGVHPDFFVDPLLWESLESPKHTCLEAKAAMSGLRFLVSSALFLYDLASSIALSSVYELMVVFFNWYCL